jgi:hypothetical protein
MAFNVLDEIVGWRAGSLRSLRVRHEDFVSHPRRTLENIVRLVGMWPAELPLVDGRTVDIRPTHTMSGHWIRHATGPVQLREDVRWRTDMPWTDRLVTTALTSPLLLAYRYPVNGGGRPDSSS